MPQTREHLAICELLGITRARGRAHEDRRRRARRWRSSPPRRSRRCSRGTPLAGAPIVRVSARTGEGLDALRAALDELAAGAAARTPRAGPPRLGVDRCFEMRGFGPVVTGTLIGGAAARRRRRDAAAGRPARARARPPVPRPRRGERAAGHALRGEPLRASRSMSCRAGSCSRRPTRSRRRRRSTRACTGSPDAPRVEEPAPVDAARGHRRAARADRADRRGRARARRERIRAPAPRGADRAAAGRPLRAARLRAHARSARRSAAAPCSTWRRRTAGAATPSSRASSPSCARRDPETDVRVRARRAGFAGTTRAALARETGRSADELAAAIESAQSRGALATRRRARARRRRARAHRAEPARRARRLSRRRAAASGHAAGALRGALPDERARPRRPSSRSRGSRARARSRSRPIACAALTHRATLAPRRAGGLRPHRARCSPRPRSRRPRCARWPRSVGRRGVRARATCSRTSSASTGSCARAPISGSTRARSTRCASACAPTSRAATSSTRRAYKALIGTSRRTAVPLMELFDAERLTVRRGEVRRLRRPRSAAR